MGDWETNLKVADFGQVEKLCREALEKKSKDLQIAAWLAEAWLKRQRFSGLASGLSLFAQLVDRYYAAGLFPELGDDDDPSARFALVEWIDDVFTDRVRTTPLGSVVEGQGFSLVDWERGGQNSGSNNQDGDGSARVTRESLLARISLGGGTRWTDVATDVATAIVAAESVEQAFAAHAQQSPTLRRLREVLATIERLARDAARTSGEFVAASAAVSSNADGRGDVAMFGSAVANNSTGPIQSRADAYYRLAEAAEYLMRTEPHSPVPYLVKRAVQWGNMSLTQLLTEFIGNPEDLVTIQRLLGMRGRDEA